MASQHVDGMEHDCIFNGAWQCDYTYAYSLWLEDYATCIVFRK